MGNLRRYFTYVSGLWLVLASMTLISVGGALAGESASRADTDSRAHESRPRDLYKASPVLDSRVRAAVRQVRKSRAALGSQGDPLRKLTEEINKCRGYLRLAQKAAQRGEGELEARLVVAHGKKIREELEGARDAMRLRPRAVSAMNRHRQTFAHLFAEIERLRDAETAEERAVAATEALALLQPYRERAASAWRRRSPQRIESIDSGRVPVRDESAEDAP